jgi:DNA-binding NarL/FixJ family response regulator
MPLRIFLVEDNSLIRQTMQEMLEEVLGAQVVAWADGENAAIEALRHTAWDVALIDLFLKQGSGLGVARALERRDAGQRIYVLSNYATPSIRERCGAIAIDGIYDKSTELDLLLEVLAQLPRP